MKLKNLILTTVALGVSACSWMYEDEAQGQIIYHWERAKTGVIKFARDHSECMRKAEKFHWYPDFNSWFYSEEVKLDIRADFHAERGIWASYVPYPGAQPLVVNSMRNDEDISPRNYRLCMEGRGYAHRSYNIPETTNIYVYRPQRFLQSKPFSKGDL